MKAFAMVSFLAAAVAAAPSALYRRQLSLLMNPSFSGAVEQTQCSETAIVPAGSACPDNKAAMGIEFSNSGEQSLHCKSISNSPISMFTRTASSNSSSGDCTSTSASVCGQDEVAIGLNCDASSSGCSKYSLQCAKYQNTDYYKPLSLRFAYELTADNCVWTPFVEISYTAAGKMDCPPKSFLRGIASSPVGGRSLLCCSGTTDASVQFASQSLLPFTLLNNEHQRFATLNETGWAALAIPFVRSNPEFLPLMGSPSMENYENMISTSKTLNEGDSFVRLGDANSAMILSVSTDAAIYGSPNFIGLQDVKSGNYLRHASGALHLNPLNNGGPCYDFGFQFRLRSDGRFDIYNDMDAENGGTFLGYEQEHDIVSVYKASSPKRGSWIKGPAPTN